MFEHEVAYLDYILGEDETMAMFKQFRAWGMHVPSFQEMVESWVHQLSSAQQKKMNIYVTWCLTMVLFFSQKKVTSVN